MEDRRPETGVSLYCKPTNVYLVLAQKGFSFWACLKDEDLLGFKSTFEGYPEVSAQTFSLPSPVSRLPSPVSGLRFSLSPLKSTTSRQN